MDDKQREEAARQIAASVREALGRILADWSVGHQIVRGLPLDGKRTGDPKPPSQPARDQQPRRTP